MGEKINVPRISTINCEHCGFTCENVALMQFHIAKKKCTNRKRKISLEDINEIPGNFSITAIDCSDAELTMDALNRYCSNSLNFIDVINGLSKKGFPYKLYEKIYKTAYGPDLLDPEPLPEHDTAFRRVIGDFLFEEIEKIQFEKRPFRWLSIASNGTEKCRRILFVRHANQWVIQHEKDWKLAFSYAEIDPNDEDVQSCILYQIISTYLVDIILSLKKNQIDLVRNRIEINLLKAVVDFEDKKITTKIFLVEDIIFDSHFCANSISGNILFVNPKNNINQI
jgi:hypothetical protein